MYTYQQTKDTLTANTKEYLSFVVKCLHNEAYAEAVNNLLPFDNFAQARLRIHDDASALKSIGIAVMRMEFEPPVLSFGISIEIAEGENNQPVNTTILISAGKTLEELRTYVQTDHFLNQVKENFEKQIELSFHSNNK